MIQITFQPALDPFHAVFRLMRLFPIIESCGGLTYEQVRVLDFYLLFPFRADEIRLLPNHRRFKKLTKATEYLKPYGELPDSIVLFERMAPIQMVAAQTLSERKYFYGEEFARGVIKCTSHLIPVELKDRIEKLNAEQENVIEFLHLLAAEYSASGKDGLKSRTGLIEYRYDKV